MGKKSVYKCPSCLGKQYLPNFMSFIGWWVCPLCYGKGIVDEQVIIRKAIYFAMITKDVYFNSMTDKQHSELITRIVDEMERDLRLEEYHLAFYRDDQQDRKNTYDEMKLELESESV